jgi:hypothetical protein
VEDKAVLSPEKKSIPENPNPHSGRKIPEKRDLDIPRTERIHRIPLSTGEIRIGDDAEINV